MLLPKEVHATNISSSDRHALRVPQRTLTMRISLSHLSVMLKSKMTNHNTWILFRVLTHMELARLIVGRVKPCETDITKSVVLSHLNQQIRFGILLN